MRIIIVGGGASGLLASIAIKKRNPNYEIILIDKNEKIGKKLRATGNGKANLLNLGTYKNKYSSTNSANKLLNIVKPQDIINYFSSLGIETINYDGYVYPYSESANSFTNSLIDIAKKLGVKIILNTKAIDYKNNVLSTDKKDYSFDKLIIASGLSSHPELGADSSFVENLKKHNYHIKKIIPSLTPIITKESTKNVNGIRRKVKFKVMQNKRCYFEEYGELLFKKDGLSGIVVFNASNAIHINNLKQSQLEIDFLPNREFKGNLKNYFQEELASYLSKISINPKKVIFNVSSFYDFKDSIASFGGVDLNDVDESFKSKIEKDIYIIGEALDQIGMCGGFNLMWAFATAIKVSMDI